MCMHGNQCTHLSASKFMHDDKHMHLLVFIYMHDDSVNGRIGTYMYINGDKSMNITVYMDIPAYIWVFNLGVLLTIVLILDIVDFNINV